MKMKNEQRERKKCQISIHLTETMIAKEQIKIDLH